MRTLPAHSVVRRLSYTVHGSFRASAARSRNVCIDTDARRQTAAVGRDGQPKHSGERAFICICSCTCTVIHRQKTGDGFCTCFSRCRNAFVFIDVVVVDDVLVAENVFPLFSFMHSAHCDMQPHFGLVDKLPRVFFCWCTSVSEPAKCLAIYILPCCRRWPSALAATLRLANVCSLQVYLGFVFTACAGGVN